MRANREGEPVVVDFVGPPVKTCSGTLRGNAKVGDGLRGGKRGVRKAGRATGGKVVIKQDLAGRGVVRVGRPNGLTRLPEQLVDLVGVRS